MDIFLDDSPTRPLTTPLVGSTWSDCSTVVLNRLLQLAPYKSHKPVGFYGPFQVYYALCSADYTAGGRFNKLNTGDLIRA